LAGSQAVSLTFTSNLESFDKKMMRKMLCVYLVFIKSSEKLVTSHEKQEIDERREQNPVKYSRINQRNFGTQTKFSQASSSYSRTFLIICFISF